MVRLPNAEAECDPVGKAPVGCVFEIREKRRDACASCDEYQGPLILRKSKISVRQLHPDFVSFVYLFKHSPGESTLTAKMIFSVSLRVGELAMEKTLIQASLSWGHMDPWQGGETDPA